MYGGGAMAAAAVATNCGRSTHRISNCFLETRILWVIELRSGWRPRVHWRRAAQQPQPCAHPVCHPLLYLRGYTLGERRGLWPRHPGLGAAAPAALPLKSGIQLACHRCASGGPRRQRWSSWQRIGPGGGHLSIKEWVACFRPQGLPPAHPPPWQSSYVRVSGDVCGEWVPLGALQP